MQLYAVNFIHCIQLHLLVISIEYYDARNNEYKKLFLYLCLLVPSSVLYILFHSCLSSLPIVSPVVMYIFN